MSFKSLLNKTCDIEVLSFESCLITGQKIESWSVLFTAVPCRLRSRAVSERKYSDPEYQKSTHALYIPCRKFAKKTLRIVLEGEVYSVVGHIDMGGKDKYLCLYIERYGGC